MWGLCCAFIHPEQSHALMLSQKPFCGHVFGCFFIQLQFMESCNGGTNGLLGPLDKKPLNIIGINITESPRTLWQIWRMQKGVILFSKTLNTVYYINFYVRLYNEQNVRNMRPPKFFLVSMGAWTLEQSDCVLCQLCFYPFFLTFVVISTLV